MTFLYSHFLCKVHLTNTSKSYILHMVTCSSILYCQGFVIIWPQCLTYASHIINLNTICKNVKKLLSLFKFNQAI